MNIILFFIPLFYFSLPVESLFGVRLRSNTPTGPCSLNNDGLKCDENGFYQLVQCDQNSCYCVTPHNALIAHDSRTNSPKTAPKCGTCYTYLQKLFSNGSPPENTFVPRCDVSHGDYDIAQCDVRSDKCYCVDAKTGKEVSGTRTTLSNTRQLKCADMRFEVDRVFFPTYDPNKGKDIDPVGRPSCLLDRNPGHTCSQNSTSIKYWFDKETFHCLPFEYKGCGGNDNNYPTSSACYQECVLMDYSSCAMQTKPAKKSDGNAFICGNTPQPPPGFMPNTIPGPTLNKDGCPRGYVCQMGAFFGFCCEETITNKFNAAFKPTCKNRKLALYEKKDGFDSAVLGKSCKDNFCPRNYKCESNDVFSFCCPY